MQKFRHGILRKKSERGKKTHDFFLSRFYKNLYGFLIERNFLKQKMWGGVRFCNFGVGFYEFCIKRIFFEGFVVWSSRHHLNFFFNEVRKKKECRKMRNYFISSWGKGGGEETRIQRRGRLLGFVFICVHVRKLLTSHFQLTLQFGDLEMKVNNSLK